MNIYLFIELLGAANPTQAVDTLKALSMDNCSFANVVMLSDEKLVAQLDCKDSVDGDKAILNKIAKVEGWCRPTSSPSCVRRRVSVPLMLRKARGAPLEASGRPSRRSRRPPQGEETINRGRAGR